MTRTRLSTFRPGRLVKVGALLPLLALALGLVGVIGVGTAQALPLLPPDPTGLSPTTACVGSVITFTGHEFYGTMTAQFGAAGSAPVYNISIPIGDNDSAQATVPAIPAGTYTVSLSDRYGSGADPVTLTVLPCAVQGPGNWNIATAKMTFKPPLHTTGKGTSALATSNFALTDPSDMLIIDKSAQAALSLSLPSNSCDELSGDTTATTSLNITWKPDSLSPTTVTFTGFTVTETSTGGVSLNFGGTGTSVSGSYATSDGGAGSTMNLTSTTTPDQLAASCASKAGLKTIAFSAGSLSLQ